MQLEVFRCLPVGMDVTVQKQLGLQRTNDVVQTFESDVRGIGVVADSERRAVRQEHVHTALVAAHRPFP